MHHRFRHRLWLLVVVTLFSSWARAGLKLVQTDKETMAAMESMKIEFIPDHYSHPTFRVGYVDDRTWTQLPKALKSKLTVLNEQRWAMGGYDKLTLDPVPYRDARKDRGYHNYAALTQALKDAQTASPGLLRTATAGKSVQGRELWYVVMTNSATAQNNKPKFIFHANMHGDEVVGRELMLYLIQYLSQNFGKDPRVTKLLNNAEIYIMPSMNPDGFEAGTRANAHGVDLNRNFPDRFTSPSDTPQGREIEVQHMMNLAQQNHFVYGINWHGGEICFNLPWGNISNADPENKFGDDSFFYPIGREYTVSNRPMHSNHHDNFDHGLTYGYEWYPVNGGINDWYNHFRRSVHSVIELSTIKWPDSNTLTGYWKDNREAMITYLMHGLYGIHLEIVDEQGQLIKNPTITVASLPNRPMRFDDSYVHRLTGPGVQKVTINVPGLLPSTVEVAAKEFDGTYLRVQLIGR